jgi:hypothetical protein
VGQDKKVEYGIFKAVKLHCDVVVNSNKCVTPLEEVNEEGCAYIRAGSSQEISMFCSTLV